jgi:hypothetical protein
MRPSGAHLGDGLPGDRQAQERCDTGLRPTVVATSLALAAHWSVDGAYR